MVRVLARKLHDKMRISKRISHQPKLSSLSYTVDFRCDTLNTSITVIHIIFWFDLVVVSLAASTAMCISSLLFVAPIRLHCSPSSSSRSVSFCTCICLIWFFHVCFWVHCIACCVLSNCNYLPYHNKINFNLKCSNLCELKHETHTRAHALRLEGYIH